MKLKVNRHEDDRRILTEWVSDSPIRTCKVLEVKEDCELGNHFHRNKTDHFHLLRGGGSCRIGDVECTLTEGGTYVAEKGVPHVFRLWKGSILLESSSTPYDKEDEIPFAF